MPSQMSGINGTNNRYHINKIINCSVIENNNSADQYRSQDTMLTKNDNSAMNSNMPTMNMLEQGMADLYTFSVPMTTSNLGMVDEYRLRLGSDDLGHYRPSNCLRRASMIDGECDFGVTYTGLSRVLSETITQWTQESIDEARLRDYCAKDAVQAGFIVGEELEMVKAKSHRSVIQTTPDRIISSFKDRYGQSDSTSKKTYLQLGVRVPTKEHVSEIVGKQGSKIKQIREKTGALITTPGEQEDHVFIIEAPPRTALHVAQILKSRAEDITMSRTQESRRRSSCPTNAGNRHTNKSPAIIGFNPANSKVVLASGRIQVPKIIVGRIIGTQGSIITTIQRDTGTEIRSPPKEIGKPKHAMADFEILVYQTTNLTDSHEAKQRVQNAKQLIAHVAMHQLEKIRSEEAPYSNYQVQAANALLNANGNEIIDEDSLSNRRLVTMNEEGSMSHACSGANKEQFLAQQMVPSEWIWSDVDRLDDYLSHEVVDRILEESKKKTKTRSEPSIYDNSGNSLFTLDESHTYSSGSPDVNRPRYSLPETRVGTMPGIAMDSLFNTPNTIQSILPYSGSDSYFMPEAGNSDFRTSPNMSFLSRPEPGSRSDLSDHDFLDFQAQDFIDNRNYNNGNLFGKSRDFNNQTLMQHMFINNGNGNGNVINNSQNVHRNYNRFVPDQLFHSENYPKHDILSNINTIATALPTPQQSLNSFYSFHGDNSHWNYTNPLSVTNGATNTNDSAMTKSYADSLKPQTNVAIGQSFPTIHGTIGDHLKKTMSNNYKG